MKISILGAGPGGYVSAIRAAQLGASVTVIESDEVGGTCLNWGCIPTKVFTESSGLLAKSRKLSDYGIDFHKDISVSLAKIIERKNRVVKTQVKGIRNLFKNWGITLIEGRGTITSPREIRVVSQSRPPEKILSDNIIIATGSKPFELPGYPFNGRTILSSDQALDLAEVPKRLVIIGGGVIGCEFASIYRELGSEITIVELLPYIISTEDESISIQLQKEFKKRKILVYTSTKVENITFKNKGVSLLLSDGKEITADKLLVAVGRTVNSERIGLENAGIQKGQHDEVVVNKFLETTSPGIFAVGDVTGGIMLAHVASREGEIAAENILGAHEAMDHTVIPNVIFTIPEIASVGMREKQAHESGMDIKTGSFQFRALGKAHVIGEIEGFVKIIAEKKSDRILGMHIIGPHASDLIHEGALAIANRLTIKQITETIHAHPTLSESIREASEDIFSRAIHKPKF